MLEGVGRARRSGGGTGTVSSGAGSVLPWAPPIRPSPLPFPTPRCCFIRCELSGPGGRRRTRAGARFWDATDAVTLLLKGKTQCPCLQPRSRNQPRSAQRRRGHRAFRVLGNREKSLLCVVAPSDTLTRWGREPVLCGREDGGRTHAEDGRAWEEACL